MRSDWEAPPGCQLALWTVMLIGGLAYMNYGEPPSPRLWIPYVIGVLFWAIIFIRWRRSRRP